MEGGEGRRREAEGGEGPRGGAANEAQLRPWRIPRRRCDSPFAFPPFYEFVSSSICCFIYQLISVTLFCALFFLEVYLFIDLSVFSQSVFTSWGRGFSAAHLVSLFICNLLYIFIVYSICLCAVVYFLYCLFFLYVF